jgi:hypothetical protein
MQGISQPGTLGTLTLTLAKSWLQFSSPKPAVDSLSPWGQLLG